MLDLDDFVHLPDLDEVVDRIAASGPGLIVVAGFDPPQLVLPMTDVILPSGRATVFRILFRRFLQRESFGRAFVIGRDREALRVPRPDRKRVEVIVEPVAAGQALRIHQAAARMPSLIVVNDLTGEAGAMVDRGNLDAALQAARHVPVLIQIDVAARSADMARVLAGFGADRSLLAHLRWAVSVQRLPGLCKNCAAPAPPDALQIAALRRSGLAGPLPEFFVARGCPVCEGAGRHGEVTIFDIFDFGAGEPALSQERYAFGLAAAGHLTLDDVLGLDSAQLRQAYRLMAGNEGALRQANAELQRRVLELESAHRVLVQRTEALNSLQRMGQVLLSDAEPAALADHVCRQVRELCGADRAVLYRLETAGRVEVLGAAGWDRSRFVLPLRREDILDLADAGSRAVRYEQWPPGVPPRSPDLEGVELRTGLRVPLVAQGIAVGVLVAHSTTRTRFEPSGVALLETLASQAAVALQRASLTSELRAKVAALEAAQRELAVKERMERELELAREVQQSFLPRDFPDFPPYSFAAENEPARQVGGDFYDVFALDDSHVALVIADVSDKGLPAALYMALTRSLIRAEARRVSSPRGVLASVNRLLLEIGEPGMFVSVFYGVLDTGAGRLVYARAGHDEPYLLRGESVIPLDARGLLLGIFDDAGDRLVEDGIQLQVGDRLVLYTDGLTDARDRGGTPVSPEGLQAILKEFATARPDVMCSATFARIREHLGGGEQDDDMTLLVVGA